MEPKIKKEKNTKPNAELGWEIKDRHYLLKGNLTPLTRVSLSAKFSGLSNIHYSFDYMKGLVQIN